MRTDSASCTGPRAREGVEPARIAGLAYSHVWQWSAGDLGRLSNERGPMRRDANALSEGATPCPPAPFSSAVAATAVLRPQHDGLARGLSSIVPTLIDCLRPITRSFLGPAPPWEVPQRRGILAPPRLERRTLTSRPRPVDIGEPLTARRRRLPHRHSPWPDPACPSWSDRPLAPLLLPAFTTLAARAETPIPSRLSPCARHARCRLPQTQFLAAILPRLMAGS